MDAEEGGGMFGNVADKSAAVPGWVLAHLAHFTMKAQHEFESYQVFKIVHLCLNVWSHDLHFPAQPWWKEQVALTFHACGVFEPPLLSFGCSSSHQSPVLFHPCRFCSCVQTPTAQSDTTLSTVFGTLVLLSAFSSCRLPRRWSHFASLFPSSPSAALSSFFCLFLVLLLLLSLSFPLFSCWLGVWVLVAAVCCV